MTNWKSIKGFDGYQVNEFGDVRSVDRVITRGNGRPLTVKGTNLMQRINKDGYHMVQLQSKGKKHIKFVHRLVWVAFNGEIPKCNENGEKLEIGHVDGDSHNNSLDNLYLCTHKENCQHYLFKKKQSNKMKGNTFSKGHVSPNRISVIRFDLDMNFEKEYDYMEQVKEDGFSIGNVCSCCNGKYGKRGNVTKNKIFMYTSEYKKRLENSNLDLLTKHVPHFFSPC